MSEISPAQKSLLGVKLFLGVTNMGQAQNTLPTSLGRLVRFWRTTFNLSQEELALELESSTRHISRLENGRVHPSRDFVLGIAKFLGLQRRDTANLLVAAGYIPDTLGVEFGAEEYRWLRKTMAINLEALDPYPTILTNGKNGILMCNKSWLGLFIGRLGLSPELPIADYFEMVMNAIALGVQESEKENMMCGLALTLRQKSLIYNDPTSDEVVRRLEAQYHLPANWPEKGAQFDPRMSFPLSFEINGQLQQFYHVSNAITSMGPEESGVEPHLVMIKLFPKDLDIDLSVLLEHDIDHPRLYTHELNKND